jgi:hypothetical protein
MTYYRIQTENAMRKTASFLMLFGLCAIPAFTAVETYKDVPVVDANCSKKVAADPDSHTRACALKCESSGFGVVTKDQQFLKCDAAGNAKVVEALKASDKKDHLRVSVTGEARGDTLKVTSIKLL